MVTSPVQQRNLALATEYLGWQRKRNRSAETIYAYTDVLHKMVSWLGETPLATVPTRMLEAFIERPRARRRAGDGPKFGEAAPATRRRDITIIRSFFRYLIERGYIATNPALAMVPPQVRNVAPKAIDDDTWRAVWCHPRLDDTERFVFGMAFFCGLRRRELVDLNADHFALADERLVGFTRKGGSESSFPYGSAVRLIAERLPRLVPEGADDALDRIRLYVMSRASMPYLLAWGDALGRDDDPRLRGRQRLDRYPEGWTPPNVLNNRLRAVLRRSGLPHDAFSPHALRHSFVSNLLRVGVPLHVVSRLASHADIATTMRYVKTAEDPLRELLGHPPHARPGRWG